ncbi:MAG: M17 family peptidase N-terminal domain-containing protein, partial [Xanthomonadales bacterium]|nr:M17 family peptidase N-terminal domain-containing protein [Xanthomonadales bacterium]
MKLSLSSSSVAEATTACLVIAVTEDGPFSPSAEAVDQASGGTLSRLVKSRDVSTSLGKTTMLHGLTGLAAERVLTIGLGKAAKLDRARWDRACLAAGKALRDHPITECHVFAHDLDIEGTDPRWRLRQLALALQRANYLYTSTKPLKDDAPVPLKSAVFSDGQDAGSALEEARGMAVGFIKARHLGDLPPNICNPAYIAQEARAIAE